MKATTNTMFKKISIIYTETVVTRLANNMCKVRSQAIVNVIKQYDQ